MKVLLVLNINPELEEDMVDYLLGLVDVEGFTSCPVRGHGMHGNMSLSEQVSGRRKRLQMELLIGQEAAETVLDGIKASVGRDIVWWIQPVINSGRID
jgi:nitrogen regulatory protein PII